jgi:hypothetical protein
MNRYITGERIQELCDVYCGLAVDFCYNPRVLAEPQRHLDLADAPPPVWHNPPLVFCYAHRLRELRRWLAVAAAPLTLVTHNSDENITGSYADICDHPQVRAMYSQNVLYAHPKLHNIPIGIANSMWGHGNLETLHSAACSGVTKTRSVYFYFGIGTNYADRSVCRAELEAKGLVFGSPQPHADYLHSLASYKFAICPAGNGIDSHRLWECLYLGVTPIVLRNTFTAAFASAFPCVVLGNWSDLDLAACEAAWRPFDPAALPALSMDHLRDCLVASKNIWCIHS